MQLNQLRIFALLALFLPFLPLPLQAINDGSRYTTSSVLSSGRWVQLKTDKNAIYKLTYDDIRKMGFSDPSKIKIYGYGGWILDEDFSKPYLDDLPEVSVYLQKGSDGIFNSGDYLLFYGRGTTKWGFNISAGVFSHENNPYSTYGSYFITESETGPKEMETAQAASNPVVSLSVFDDYRLHERDSIAVISSGRELFGESFIGVPSRTFSFSVPGITQDAGKICVSFAGAPPAGSASVPVYMTADEGTRSLVGTVGSIRDYVKGSKVEAWVAWAGSKSEQVKVKVEYNASGQTVANLNFITLNMKRTLKSYNENFTFFRNREAINKQARFLIENASPSMMVWDITGNYDTRVAETSFSGSQLAFTAAADASLREYVLIDPSKTFPTPQVAGEIANQNLHALPQTEMVIISPEPYLHLAEALAEKHRTFSGLHVTVVRDSDIYNEFSSGARDATAYRRFMKMFYDRATSDEEKPKYLLFYGDILSDNRHLTKGGAALNPRYYLVSYQVKESLSELGSYGTDDYFGFLDDNEGTYLPGAVLDIGIGRFPVNSVADAENALNKVLKYMDNSTYGSWKNKTIFTADNTDYYTESSFCNHASESEEHAVYMEASHPEYMVTRYYLDAYKSTLVNGKTTYPEAKKAFLSTLNEGCFLLNYVGHGSINAWSAEDLLDISDVRQMKFEQLPLWITATCDFGWPDGLVTSAGEEAFLNANSGAIALLTTSRVVQSGDNKLINAQFVRMLFQKKDGKYRRLGDVIRDAKVRLGANSNKLNFILLGDPALVLNYPEYRVELQAVDGEPIGDGDIKLQALNRVTLEGIITDGNGNQLVDFNGTLITNIFDSKQTLYSVSQNDKGNRFSFNSYPNRIYSSGNEVKDGAFKFTFNVPLDISYAEDYGKMSFYAYDEVNSVEANGSYSSYYFSGTGDYPSYNEEGPQIKEIYLNTPEFWNGGQVNETPYLFATVYDEDGINVTGSGSGHDIWISIDNNPAWSYSLNDYYLPVNAMEGNIGFSIPELPAGEHRLLFRAWDILNNSTSDTLTFTVVPGLKPQIIDLTASLNPARINTSFLLSCDFPETVLEVEVYVYDMTGRAVWSRSSSGSTTSQTYYPVEWDLTSSAGTRVRPGVYIYRASVRTTTSKTVTQAKKIIVLGQ